jgi:glutamyl-tRNA synthetase
MVLLRAAVADIGPWDKAALEGFARAFSERTGAGLGKIAQPLRAALTGSAAPSTVSTCPSRRMRST